MNIKEFGQEMAKDVRDILGNGYEVKYTEVIKNNGVMYHALSIKKEDQNIAPTIYIDGLFDYYNRGCLMKNLVTEVIRMYRISTPKHSAGVEFYQDFSKVAGRLHFKVVNYEKNKDKLESIPYRRALDLALVPLCRYRGEEIGDGVITIQNSHLKLWEITEEELWENVFENAEKNSPVKITGLIDFIEKISGQSCGIDEMGDMSDAGGMCIVSNESGMYGASTVFYPGVLREIADNMETDLFVIPSSVHEVIILPDPNFTVDISELRTMIHEVNVTTVKDEEVLSDNLYVYDRETDRLYVVGGDENKAYA